MLEVTKLCIFFAIGVSSSWSCPGDIIGNGDKRNADSFIFRMIFFLDTLIESEAVETAKIDDKAVTSVQLGDKAVITAKLDDKAVTSVQLGDKAVITAKLDDKAVITRCFCTKSL